MNNWTEEAKAFILANYKGCGPKEMVVRIRTELGADLTPNQVKGFYATHKLNSGLTGRFEKGHVSYNKGIHSCPAGCEKSWFPEGHHPANTDPVGTIKVKADGYIWKKISDDKKPYRKNWRQLHILLWEEANGPVPSGHIIIFRDGNRNHCVLSNLMCISRSEHAVLNKFGLRSDVPELAEASILLAKIKRQRYKREREKSKDKKRD